MRATTSCSGELLLDAPTLMGVESIEVDIVTLRLVARTLPGKQFEAGRRLRCAGGPCACPRRRRDYPDDDRRWGHAATATEDETQGSSR